MTNEREVPREQKLGSINKCPSCGAPLAAFAAKCELCDHELVNVEASRTISSLVESLAQIDRDIDGRNEGLGLVEKARQKAIIEKRGQVIRDFAIPNSREDLQNLLYYMQPKILDAVKPDPNAAEWRAKYIEVLGRAKRAYKGDAAALADLQEFEQALEGSVSDSLKIIAKRSPVMAITFAIGLVAVGLIAFAAYQKQARIRQEQVRVAQCEERFAQGSITEKARLAMLADQIRREIELKKFTDAKLHADNLHWEYSDSCKQEATSALIADWDKKRAELIALSDAGSTQIVEKAASNERAASEAKIEKQINSGFEENF